MIAIALIISFVASTIFVLFLYVMEAYETRGSARKARLREFEQRLDNYKEYETPAFVDLLYHKEEEELCSPSRYAIIQNPLYCVTTCQDCKMIDLTVRIEGLFGSSRLCRNCAELRNLKSHLLIYASRPLREELVKENGKVKCFMHKRIPAVTRMKVEGGGIVGVCGPCKERYLGANRGVRWKCRFCGVPIVSKEITKAQSGLQHGSTCPRKEQD